jgi:SpoVK/Ycf46/Vps4 family AAA+-type ATPase
MDDKYTKIHEGRVLNERNIEYIENMVFEYNNAFFVLYRNDMIEEEDDDEYYYENKISISILYKDFSLIKDEVEKIKKYKSEPRLISKIHIISKNHYGFTLKDFNINKVKVDIGLNYGESFVEKNKFIIKSLKDENKSGLIMLDGLPGTGKSTYIKYLTNKVDKKFIFFPSNMAEELMTPGFIDFMLNQKGSILVIEDAEKIIRSREGSNNSNAISNLLNVSDGILGDLLKIKIIATHNTKREKIDQALLRKGRLMAEHEFDKLPVESVRKLMDKLKIKYEENQLEPMTLSDIYEFGTENFSSIKKDNKIGFK